jgi:predicted CopG family antitoxin
MGKTIKVHEDTHAALKRMKAQKRSRSIDEVVRELIKESTGIPVEKLARARKSVELTAYMNK